MAETATEGASISDVLELEEARNLLEAAHAAGRVSAEEIALALDELGLEPAQIEDVYRALEELQVESVDAPAATETKEAAARLLEQARGECGAVLARPIDEQEVGRLARQALAQLVEARDRRQPGLRQARELP